MYKLSLAFFCVLGLCTLSACNDDESKDENRLLPQETARQLENKKYNKYINAYNRSIRHIPDTYRQDLQQLEEIVANGHMSNDIRNLRAGNNINSGIQFLREAKAYPGVVPEIDIKIDAILVALHDAAPIVGTLKRYVRSKGYITDNGQKVRDLMPSYRKKMTNILTAIDAFSSYLKAREENEIQDAFESAEPDTTQYYVYGILYYGRESLEQQIQLVKNPAVPTLQTTYLATLDKMAALTASWSQNKLPQFCTVPAHTNAYIASGRTIIKQYRNGKALKADGAIDDPYVAYDYQSQIEGFNRVINAINSDGC